MTTVPTENARLLDLPPELRFMVWEQIYLSAIVAASLSSPSGSFWSECCRTIVAASTDLAVELLGELDRARQLCRSQSDRAIMLNLIFDLVRAIQRTRT